MTAIEELKRHLYTRANLSVIKAMYASINEQSIVQRYGATEFY